MIQIKPSIFYGEITKKLLGSHIYGENILVVSSKTVWRESYLRGVIDDFPNNYTFKIFTHIKANAPFSDIQKVIDDYSSEQLPDTIIAIGGGSIIDAGKALSVSFQQISLYELFNKLKPLPRRSINLIAIPTTAGTGAELSHGAIIFDDVNKIKGGIRGEIIQPNVVFIDPELYRTAPKQIIAEVGFDCLTHAIETYLSLKSDPLLKYQSVAAIKTVFNFLPRAVEGDIFAIKNMAIASSLMGINLAYSSTCLPHRIQYFIGPLTDTSHAQGLIALYKGWMKLISFNSVKSGLNNLELDLGNNFNLVDKIHDLKETLDINYSISTLGVKETQIEHIAENIIGSVQNDPIYKNKHTIIKILNESL
jgi:alcohol dehydrogenase class IV